MATARDAKPETAIAFFNCRFLNCHFYNVTLYLHEDVHAEASRAIQGLNWITPPPSKVASTSPRKSRKPEA